MEILFKDLFENFDISVRAFNACDRVKIKTIGDAQRHLLTYGSFLNIQNCGSYTNKELIACIEKFSEVQNTPSSIDETDNSYPISHHLSDKVINALVIAELNKLSVRARNGILLFFDGNAPTKEQIKECLIDKKLDSQKIRNIGKKSIPEIELFIKAIVAIYNKSANSIISETEKVSSTFYDLVGFYVESEFWLNKYYENQIPIILFASQHITQIFELKEVDAYILRNDFNLLEKRYTLDEIAMKYELSKERIRQRRDNIFSIVLSKASKLIPLLEHSNYNIAFLEESIISVPSDIKDESVRKEIEEVGEIFSTFILSILSNHKYYSINSLDKLKRPKVVQYYDRYNPFKAFQCSYLINDSAISKIELLKICSEVLSSLSISQDSNSSINISKILGRKISQEGSNVVAEIVKSHFGIQMQGNIIPISRNSAKLVFEYIYEALMKIGKPAHLTEIREVILNEYPDFASSEEAMRGSINNRKSIFICFGRTSTYGLKFWEKKSDFIKGGTIRSIVIDFLGKQETPCHISTITEQVRKYRKTDERSVLTNLKYAKEEIFFFQHGGYVGLTNKNYIKNGSSKINKEVVLDELLKGIFSK